MIFADPFLGKSKFLKGILSKVLTVALLFSFIQPTPVNAAAPVSIPAKIEAENWTASNSVANETCTDAGGGQDVGNIRTGSWMDYSVDVATSGTYQVDFRLATKYAGKTFQLKDGSGNILANVNVPNTGGWQTWTTVSAQVSLTTGVQTLRIVTDTGNFNVNWIDFTLSSSEPPTPTAISIPGQVDAVKWTEMYGVQTEPSSDSGSGTVANYIDAGDWMKYNVNVAAEGDYLLDFRVSSASGGGIIQLQDSSDTVLASVYVPSTGGWYTWATLNTTVHLKAGTQTLRAYVVNGGFNLNWIKFSVPISIPGQVDAVKWSDMYGVQTESSSDSGIGTVVNYIDAGDWMKYIVNVAAEGDYSLDFRVAAASGGGIIQLQDSSDTVLASVYVPSTGGWYTWSTLNTTVHLKAGTQTLRVYAANGGFNLNWIKFSAPTSIPGQVDAVKWSDMNGLQTESSSDSGCGTVANYIDAGDWMKYKVNVAADGFYSVDFRVASPSGGGNVQLKDDTGTVLATIDIPSSGSWSSWKTISTFAYLKAGVQNLTVYVNIGGFNFNWMNFNVSSLTPKGIYTIAGDKNITIGWDSVSEAVYYKVKRSNVSEGPYQEIGNVATNKFSETNLENNTTYYYVINTVTAFGESEFTSPIAVTPTTSYLTALSGIKRDGQITLQWAAVPNATSYDLMKSVDGGVTYTVFASGLSITSYTDAGLTNNTNYQYIIQAKGSAGILGNSNILQIAPTAPLDRPTALTEASGSSSVQLTWNAVTGASYYTVKRSTVSGMSYTVIADNINDTTYTDTTVTNDTTYFYVVSASNPQTESMNSEQIIAYPSNILPGTPSIPENVTVTPGSNRMLLKWSPVTSATSYNIKRADTFTGPYTTITNTSGTEYSDTGLTNGKTYYYTVSAVNAVGEGARCSILSATPAEVIIVAKDGSGDFSTIGDALAAIPAGNAARKVIYIKKGTYNEKLNIPSTKPYVSLIGEDRDGTIISWADSGGTGVGTSTSYTVLVSAKDFSAENLTIQNAAFPVTTAGVAVALHVDADRAIFNNIRIVGFQDSLFTYSGRQYYKNCIIEGNVDWIFGGANAVFDNSEIKFVGNGGGYVTAASTDQLASFGYTFLNSRLTRGTTFLKGQVSNWDSTYDTDANVTGTNSSVDLGRPWRSYANVKYINTYMDAHIRATGWSNWGNAANELTTKYGEYNTIGPGANPSGRLKWTSQLSNAEANQHTIQNVLKGSDGWDPTLFGVLPISGQPPVAPTGLTITYQNGAKAALGDTPVTLTWNTLNNAKTYNVYRSTTSDGNYTKVASDLVAPNIPMVAMIEAENYAAMNGVKVEATQDTGGGSDLGYIDAGDWMDYSITVPADGDYTVEVRVASPNTGKQIQIKSSDGTVLALADIPQTGGWQSWTTLNVIVNLKAGTQTLRFYSVNGGINFNWFKLMQGLDGKIQYTDNLYNTGVTYYYAVTAVNGNGESVYSTISQISNGNVVFDRNIAVQSDISVSVQIAGDSVTGINFGATQLVPDIDYTVSNNIFTLNKAFLKKLPIGTDTITFTFSSGKNIPLTISVINTTPLPGQTISKVQPLTLYTTEGVEPYLPHVVPVIYTDTSEKALPVVWNSISPDKYAAVGSFTTNGVIKGTDVQVIAYVNVQALNTVSTATGGNDLQNYMKNLPFEMPQINLPTFADKDFNIVDYGAVGDGKTKNTKAFADAIAAASANPGGGRVIVPAGVWYTGPISMQSNVNLHLEDGATVLFSSDLDDFFNSTGGIIHMLSASGLTNIAITGNGTFDGNGQYWRPVKKDKVTSTQWNYLLSLDGVVSDDGGMWYPSQRAVNIARPILLNITNCTNILTDGPIFMNAAVYAQNYSKDQYLVIRNTTSNNDWWYQNGDGLDVSASQNVVLYHNTINAGDDGIGMKSSYLPSPTNTQANVIISDNIVFRAHGGVSFGSNTSAGIKNVVIRNNQYIGTDAGLNIKTYVGNGGPIENIYMDNIHMKDIVGSAISISDFYTGHNDTLDNAVLGVDAKVPEVKNIHISNITVDGAEQAVNIDALHNVPVHDIDMTNVTINSTVGWVSANTTDFKLKNVQITATNSPIYTLTNASNMLFDNVLVPAGTGTFLHLAGTADNISIVDTNYTAAGVPFQLDAGISPSVIIISNPGTITKTSAPANLGVIAGSSQVLLSWDTVSGADYYAVKRSTTSLSGYQTVATNIKDNKYIDTGLGANKYYYIVTAVNSAGESENSNEVNATIAAPSVSLPLTYITGVSSSFENKNFNLTYGLSDLYMGSNTNLVIASQEVVLEYDPNIIHFVSADSIMPGVNVESASIDNTIGKATVRLKSIASGVAPNGDMLRITCKAVGTEHAGDAKTFIKMTKATIQDGLGVVSTLSNTIYSLDILIDKAALVSKLSFVQALDAGSYLPESWAVLNSYIVSANSINNNTLATQSQVDAAVNNLQMAMDLLKFIPSKSVLGSNIATAQAAVDTASIGERWGQYTQSAKDKLNSAISSSNLVLNNPNADQNAIEQAITAIETEKQNFLGSVKTIASIGDLSIISAHYGVTSTDSQWTQIQRYDINHDGKLDIIDLSAIAQKF